MSSLDRLIDTFSLDPTAALGLHRYLELLLSYEQANVTGLRTREQIVERLVGDSLALLDVEEARERSGASERQPWADLGSGAGVPGIPLALALPGVAMTLIESVGKKCVFLEEAVREARLAGRAQVARTRSEALAAAGSPAREAFVVVTAKAVGSLATAAELGAPLVQVGGVLLAHKTGRSAREEAAQGEVAGAACGLALRRLVPLARSPLADSACVVFEKVAPSPAWLPRREGRARSKPLS